jgi:predicted ATPase
VLDEPTVGLHAADVPALANVMRELSRPATPSWSSSTSRTIVRAAIA